LPRDNELLSYLLRKTEGTGPLKSWQPADLVRCYIQPLKKGKISWKC